MLSSYLFCLSKGPTDEELCLREDVDICLESDSRRRRRADEEQRWQERIQENWENCLVCMHGYDTENQTSLTDPPSVSFYLLAFFSQELNLSYQDLGDPFQQENFLRILQRLIRVEKLQLVDNSLTDLSSVRLPRCDWPICLTPECTRHSSHFSL